MMFAVMFPSDVGNTLVSPAAPLLPQSIEGSVPETAASASVPIPMTSISSTAAANHLRRRRNAPM